MSSPLLSICLPTHDGRAATLAHALDSVLGQLGPETAGLVEVCVSDNASVDGTADLVRHAADRHPNVISYRRNELDLGGPRNLFLAVEMARGRWCWLLSSDDALAPGAIVGALGLIEHHATASGLTVGWSAYDRLLGELVGPDCSQPPFNAGTRERSFTTAAGIFTQCGPLFDYMSIHIFRRELWQTALSGLDDGAQAGTMYPTTLMLGRICAEQPSWIWSPLEAVRARAGNQVLMSAGGVDPARLRARAFADQRRVWSALLPGHRALQRQIALRWVELYANREALHGDRRNPDTRVGGQLRLLATLARALGRSRRFWLTTLPLLMVPAPVDKALRHRNQRPSKPLPAAACRTRVRPDLAGISGPGGSQKLACELENLGQRTLCSAMPNPVHLSYRWLSADSGELALEGQRTPLDPPLQAGERRTYELTLSAPPQPGDYLLRISPVQELVAWFDELDRDNGWAAPVRVVRGSDCPPGERTIMLVSGE
jgi:glycosyltransferase involved in cell wall biosynthesis